MYDYSSVIILPFRIKKFTYLPERVLLNLSAGQVCTSGTKNIVVSDQEIM